MIGLMGGIENTSNNWQKNYTNNGGVKMLDFDDLRKMLEGWAEWSLRFSDCAGYAKTSMTGRIMKQKEAACIRGTAHIGQINYVDMPSHIERIESAITRMDKQLQDAIRVRYLYFMPDSDRAKKLNLGETLYRKRLYTAHEVLRHIMY